MLAVDSTEPGFSPAGVKTLHRLEVFSIDRGLTEFEPIDRFEDRPRRRTVLGAPLWPLDHRRDFTLLVAAVEETDRWVGGCLRPGHCAEEGEAIRWPVTPVYATVER